MGKQININFIEWDAKHKHTLIRLVGDLESQEIRLGKMKAAEDMYEALKEYSKLGYTKNGEGCALISLVALGKVSNLIEQALAKADSK